MAESQIFSNIRLPSDEDQFLAWQVRQHVYPPARVKALHTGRRVHFMWLSSMFGTPCSRLHIWYGVSSCAEIDAAAISPRATATATTAQQIGQRLACNGRRRC